MKRNDEINHGMIDKLAYKGHDQDHPNVLDYVNKRVEKIQAIKYQAECPFCHPCTDENANYLTLKLASLLNDPKNGQKPLYVCRAFGEETGFIMACYMNSKGQKRMKLFNIQFYEANPFIVPVLEQFTTPNYCPKCGRKLDDD